jgi:glycosyltransferase involved in cell wall biosynthesis
MTARPHLLYTAWSFPPSRAGGVYRALATVNAFAGAGWDVTVLTVPRTVFTQSTGADFELEKAVHPGVTIERVDPDVPAYQNDLRAWPRGRAVWPEFWRLADFRRDVVRFPEPNYGRWRPRLQQAADRIHAAKPVDLAIGTANPHVDFVPGWHLHRKHGVPYVMDYRDAWQLDVFSGTKLVTATPAVARWERRLVDAAAEVWFVNEPIRQWHAQRYADRVDKMHVVANGFDEYGASLAVPVREHGADDPLVFGYIGTITDKVPLPELIAGWRAARELSPVVARARLVLRGYLGHFATASSTVEQLLDDARRDGVSFEGPVSKSAVAATYQSFDALLLVLGTGRYVTSGKVYEYAATGLPVVSVHDLGNAATDVISQSPAWVPAKSLAAQDVAAALVEAAELAGTQTPQQRAEAQAWGAQYERSRQLAPRIEALAARVQARRASSSER